jgi:hypothetical protein
MIRALKHYEKEFNTEEVLTLGIVIMRALERIEKENKIKS